MTHKNTKKTKFRKFLSEKVNNLLAFLCFLKNENNCIFLCQNFGISKKCTIFVIQSINRILYQ